MIVYHGSSKSNLKNLEYSEENSRFGGDMNLVHGSGIYLTISKEEALAYATASLYKVHISAPIFDATDTENLENFVSALFSKWEVPDLVQHSAIQTLIKQTAMGKISGVGFADSLLTVLSNDFSLYAPILQGVFNDDLDKLESEVKSAFNFPYIKVHHQMNGTDWVIGLDHSGVGLEILEETIIVD